MADPFDPIAILHALDQHGVSYVVVGALARVLHGSDELTDGIDIVPAMKDENLRRLGGALADLDGRRSNGRALSLDRDLAGAEVLELSTSAGELKVVPEPAGTAGYDDLRRGASREPLGRGVRPSVASPGDLARMLAVFDREQDRVPLQTMRRLIELDRGRTSSGSRTRAPRQRRRSASAARRSRTASCPSSRRSRLRGARG
jgi:hypothetical protein